MSNPPPAPQTGMSSNADPTAITFNPRSASVSGSTLRDLSNICQGPPKTRRVKSEYLEEGPISATQVRVLSPTFHSSPLGDTPSFKVYANGTQVFYVSRLPPHVFISSPNTLTTALNNYKSKYHIAADKRVQLPGEILISLTYDARTELVSVKNRSHSMRDIGRNFLKSIFPNLGLRRHRKTGEVSYIPATLGIQDAEVLGNQGGHAQAMKGYTKGEGGVPSMGGMRGGSSSSGNQQINSGGKGDGKGGAGSNVKGSQGKDGKGANKRVRSDQQGHSTDFSTNSNIGTWNGANSANDTVWSEVVEMLDDSAPTVSLHLNPSTLCLDPLFAGRDRVKKTCTLRTSSVPNYSNYVNRILQGASTCVVNDTAVTEEVAMMADADQALNQMADAIQQESTGGRTSGTLVSSGGGMMGHGVAEQFDIGSSGAGGGGRRGAGQTPSTDGPVGQPQSSANDHQQVPYGPAPPTHHYNHQSNMPAVPPSGFPQNVNGQNLQSQNQTYPPQAFRQNSTGNAQQWPQNQFPTAAQNPYTGWNGPGYGAYTQNMPGGAQVPVGQPVVQTQTHNTVTGGQGSSQTTQVGQGNNGWGQGGSNQGQGQWPTGVNMMQQGGGNRGNNPNTVTGPGHSIGGAMGGGTGWNAVPNVAQGGLNTHPRPSHAGQAPNTNTQGRVSGNANPNPVGQVPPQDAPQQQPGQAAPFPQQQPNLGQPQNAQGGGQWNNWNGGDWNGPAYNQGPGYGNGKGGKAGGRVNGGAVPVRGNPFLNGMGRRGGNVPVCGQMYGAGGDGGLQDVLFRIGGHAGLYTSLCDRAGTGWTPNDQQATLIAVLQEVWQRQYRPTDNLRIEGMGELQFPYEGTSGYTSNDFPHNNKLKLQTSIQAFSDPLTELEPSIATVVQRIIWGGESHYREDRVHYGTGDGDAIAEVFLFACHAVFPLASESASRSRFERALGRIHGREGTTNATAASILVSVLEEVNSGGRLTLAERADVGNNRARLQIVNSMVKLCTDFLTATSLNQSGTGISNDCYLNSLEEFLVEYTLVLINQLPRLTDLTILRVTTQILPTGVSRRWTQLADLFERNMSRVQNFPEEQRPLRLLELLCYCSKDLRHQHDTSSLILTDWQGDEWRDRLRQALGGLQTLLVVQGSGNVPNFGLESNANSGNAGQKATGNEGQKQGHVNGASGLNAGTGTTSSQQGNLNQPPQQNPHAGSQSHNAWNTQWGQQQVNQNGTGGGGWNQGWQDQQQTGGHGFGHDPNFLEVNTDTGVGRQSNPTNSNTQNSQRSNSVPVPVGTHSVGIPLQSHRDSSVPPPPAPPLTPTLGNTTIHVSSPNDAGGCKITVNGQQIPIGGTMQSGAPGIGVHRGPNVAGYPLPVLGPGLNLMHPVTGSNAVPGLPITPYAQPLTGGADPRFGYGACVGIQAGNIPSPMLSAYPSNPGYPSPYPMMLPQSSPALQTPTSAIPGTTNIPLIPNPMFPTQHLYPANAGLPYQLPTASPPGIPAGVPINHAYPPQIDVEGNLLPYDSQILEILECTTCDDALASLLPGIPDRYTRGAYYAKNSNSGKFELKEEFKDLQIRLVQRMQADGTQLMKIETADKGSTTGVASKGRSVCGLDLFYGKCSWGKFCSYLHVGSALNYNQRQQTLKNFGLEVESKEVGTAMYDLYESALSDLKGKGGSFGKMFEGIETSDDLAQFTNYFGKRNASNPAKFPLKAVYTEGASAGSFCYSGAQLSFPGNWTKLSPILKKCVEGRDRPNLITAYPAAFESSKKDAQDTRAGGSRDGKGNGGE